MRFTVAIDGPAAAGKGTISRAVAERFGLAHLDTGLLYRATGRRVMAGEDPVAAARALRPADLEADGLRSPEVAQAASRIAALPAVRAALVAFQRDFARREGGAVLDGRDIGTVICPRAEVKLFVTARADIRARRRFDELCAGGYEGAYEQVLADVEARDMRDRERADAPLRPARDAVAIDTSELDIEAAVARAVAEVDAALGRRGTPGTD
ncbi:cytidylate kinase [Brevirhabdus pacifica]|uniref:Cytidylate kinase n=1 Tax=Brevirhabdus pacifica TaxID=1267768 RepID=A0A1U7DKE1_9RHOB|nr:(d)CMP kinase [Brevirhabdus pacifica]APX90456.1 cytidylate kinase [Brevirhabdus pacifica]OWU78526.1 cytidylate kinase [Loktanella sp. 22II-4b]PJJ85443.1 cytidylate kinase [Brevirhabdus pacifica]